MIPLSFCALEYILDLSDNRRPWEHTQVLITVIPNWFFTQLSSNASSQLNLGACIQIALILPIVKKKSFSVPFQLKSPHFPVSKGNGVDTFRNFKFERKSFPHYHYNIRSKAMWSIEGYFGCGTRRKYKVLKTWQLILYIFIHPLKRKEICLKGNPLATHKDGFKI